MPRRHGWSDEVIHENIRHYVRKGRDVSQAVAIAFSEAREDLKKEIAKRKKKK